MPAEQRGQVIHVKMESTGNRRNSCLGGSPAGLPWGGTSRMRRESHVRICEGLGVKVPGPTRRVRQLTSLPRSPTILREMSPTSCCSLTWLFQPVRFAPQSYAVKKNGLPMSSILRQPLLLLLCVGVVLLLSTFVGHRRLAAACRKIR